MTSHNTPTGDIPPIIGIAALLYGEMVLQGEKNPVALVAAVLDVSRATAHRYLARARKAGLLPEVAPGRLASVAEHEPRRARWTGTDEGWLACRTCKQPWPCSEGAKP